MPVAAELADERPDRVGFSFEIDPLHHALQLRVRRGEVREIPGAGFGGLCRAALELFAIAIHKPGQEDVDDVGIDCAPTARLVCAPVQRASLDLQMTDIGDRLRY